ncbi:MAG: hypothetical protein HY568_04595, partial [Candidatus Latescibacteria bacterium]|nr:hypothetical protein [Candidatus Latescibacterota bacterium]
MRARAVLLAVLLAASFASRSSAQYIYLDSNGDGYSTTADQLAPTGTTTFAVWLRTDANRDGSRGLCFSDDGELTFRSYEIVLHARDGTVTWSAFSNGIAEFTDALGTQSDGADYRTGFAGSAELPPGAYLLGTIDVGAVSGTPSLEFAATTPLGPTFRTAFGSACSGTDFDHFLKLGLDWSDADGAPWGAPAGGVVALDQPSNMTLVEGETADQALSATDSDGLPITFSLGSGPSFAAVTTVAPGTGVAAG